MKIAFIGEKIFPVNTVGIEKYVEEVSLCMAAKGHEVFIYAFDWPGHAGQENIQTDLLPKILKKFPAWLWVLWASVDCARKKYDVVHYQSQDTFFFSKLVKFFCKQSKIVSSFDLVCDFKVKPGLKFEEDHEENILSHWKLRKKRYMLLADDICKESGAHFLIEAFKQLENTATTPNNFKLVILPTGQCDEDYLKYLRTISEGRDNIIILEKQTEKINWRIFSSAQLFVEASYLEKQNNEQLTRAMLCGVTPLVSDTKHNLVAVGMEGYCFESKSLESLRDKLAYLLSRTEEVDKAGQKARKKIESEFGWEKIAQKTIETCKNC